MKPTTLAIVIAAALVPVLAFALIKPKTNTAVQPAATPSADPTAAAEARSAHKVKLATSMGDIVIDLFPEDSPKTVANFVTLGVRGYYGGVIFHRVIKDFVIQGGDPTGTGSGGESIYGPTFADEINGRKIVKGSLAMANRGKGTNSNSSQFFIVTASAQPGLDGIHTNFGQIAADSQPVVDAIAAVPVGPGDKPRDPVTITGFTVLQD